ncbi:PadR family transcriptional regulator [Evansella sp. LMS18]|uniref:PadR family transcriptional regulator n=1 Tax=Evansella sp. LMS18 TaxID=2924033 RepID=UPI0020D005BD|nr:PadR family transcriptional regulator [Evansella sp. LMS18]UTR10005.1 PadR family transcriptional regulator [Evansella sp. LMS18]
MGDPFTNLKSALKKTVFKDISFSEERKNAVRNSLQERLSSTQLQSWKEETLTAVLELLQHEGKDGYEISSLLFQKNDLSFQNKEGELYTLLHLLENKRILASRWCEEKKYYSLTGKGKKILAVTKRGKSPVQTSLKQLILEASV